MRARRVKERRTNEHAQRVMRYGIETRFADNVRERALDALIREIEDDDEFTRRVMVAREWLDGGMVRRSDE